MEVLVRSSDKPPKRCRKCGGTLEKQFSSPAIQFKGEGWYVTDYARKGSVAEKVEKELSSSDGSADKPAAGDKDKTKKTPAKKTDKA
jgi:putative FmdB family regulatory protein